MLVLLLAFAASANAQTLADYQFSTGHDNSRWVALDSTRNLLVDGSAYYRRSYLEDIGFDFPFADTVYSQFSVTLAGDLRLGGTRALTNGNTQGSPFHPTRAALNKPKINFFGCTGYVSDSAYVHRQVFGEYPDRVLVVDFALQTYNTSSRPSLFRYQVHLHENGDIEVVYPSQVPPRMPAVQRMQGLCYDENDVWIVDNNHVATHYVGGCSSYVPSGYWPDTNRYYRFEYPNGVCQMPTDFLAVAADTSSVSLKWNNPAQASMFAVEYATTPIAVGTGSGTVLTTGDTNMTVDNLQGNTQYYFYVRSVCDDGDTSNAALVIARTFERMPVSDFPYYCDFETASERDGWFMPAGNLTTRWFVDTAANNTAGGTYALYISQDSGRTNTGGNQWVGAYAWRDVNLEAGDWTVSFDWRAVGDMHTDNYGSSLYYHYLRAFLVPASVTFTVQTPASFPVSPHPTAVPNGWIDLVPQSHVLLGQSSWTSHQATVTVGTPGSYHLVFYWETDGYEPETDRPAAVDNIAMERLSCAQPQQLTASATEDEMLLTWHRGGDESLWMVRYGTAEVYVQDTFYLATDLEFNTSYTFEVYSVCGYGDTSQATVGTFHTALGSAVTQFPYLCDFEDTVECRHWVSLGNGQQNQWAWGSAVNNTPQGQRAIYVSNDGGASNAYSGNAAATSYVYREMVMEPNTYFCSFDWRCLGDADFHFFRAFVVPIASLPTAGGFPVANNYYSAVPAGWIDLNPQTHYMSGQANWQTLSHTFQIADSGRYALLLMWSNDNYQANNPPAAVDNISIGFITCTAPANLAADVSMTMVDLTWTAGTDAATWLVEYADTAAMCYTPSYTALGLTPNTEYVFRIRALCYSGDTSLATVLSVRTGCNAIVSLPYFCDFESYAAGTGSDENFIPCWNRICNSNTFTPKVSSGITPDGNYLYWNVGLSDSLYVVLPELDESINVTYTELAFKAMKYDPIGFFEDPVLVVGVMTDPGSASTFSPVDTIVVSADTLSDYSVSMLPYIGAGHYVAVRCYVAGPAGSSALCVMDDVELRELQYCHKPTAMTAEAGVDTIALSWFAGGDETQWQLSYGDTTLTTSTPSYVARNLVANTEYLFLVAAICSEGDTSETLTGRFRTLPRPQDPPDTVECLVPSGVGYYQDTPWAYYAYEFHFYWSGDAPAYEVAIYCLNEIEEQAELRFVVEDTVFFFDAQGRGANWTMTVRSLCSDTVSSGWSDTVEFDTPLCVGVETPGTESGIALYPNPSKGRSTLLLSGMEGMVDVRVVDLNGRLKGQYSVDCSSQSTQALLLDGLATGTYFVRVAGSDAIMVRKLVVR